MVFLQSTLDIKSVKIGRGYIVNTLDLYSISTPSQAFLLLKSLGQEKSGKDISYYELADICGIASRTKMKKMLKGDLRMPKKVLHALANYFELDPAQANYLDLLRIFSESDDARHSLDLYSKIVDLKKKNGQEKHSYELEEKQLKLLEEWYYLPVCYFIGLKGASADTFEIVRGFKGQLSSEQVLEALRVLVEIDILRYTPNGNLVRVHKSITILDGIPRPLIKKFHQLMIQKAQDSIYSMPIDKRHLMSATLNVRSERVEELRQKIEEFVVMINDEYCDDDADSLHQLNTQLFSVAQVAGKN